MKINFALLFIIQFIAINTAIAQVTFEKGFGGENKSGDWDDWGESGLQTADGGYIIAGYSDGFDTTYNCVFVLKLNQQGDTVWTKAIIDSNDTKAKAIAQATDGGFIIAGRIKNDAYLLKIDSAGNKLWSKTFGSTIGIDWFAGVEQSADGGYVATGHTNSFGYGGYDIYVVKTTSSGDILWTKTYGSQLGESARAIKQTPDGGYIICGTATLDSVNNTLAVFVVKTNAQGDTLWTKKIGSRSSGNSLALTADGGYIVAGIIEQGPVISRRDEVYLVKLNSTGDTAWTKSIRGPKDQYANSVQQTASGGYVVTGARLFNSGSGDWDILVIKTDAVGDTVWTRLFGYWWGDYGNSVVQTADGGYFVCGSGRNIFGGTNMQVYVIKLEADENINSLAAETAEDVNWQVYPNPSTGKLTVDAGNRYAQLFVYNLMGEVVFSCPLKNTTTGIDLSMYPEGMYMLIAEIQGQRVAKKVIIRK